jgi:predicted MFS family arabinose efflux permease
MRAACSTSNKTESSYDSEPGRYRWVVSILLMGGGAINLEARLIIFVLVPLLRRDLGVTDVQTAALMTIFLWTYALCSPLAGYVGDRFSRRRVLIGSLAGSSCVMFVSAAAGSAGFILASRVLLGMVQGFYIPASLSILSDYNRRGSRGKVLALVNAGIFLGPTLGGAAAGWVGEHYGWRVALAGFAAFGLIYCAILVRWLREIPPGASDVTAGIAAAPAPSFAVAMGRLARIPSFLCLGLVSGITAVATWMLSTWLSVFLYDSFGMTLAQSGFFGNLAVTGAGIAGALGGGFLSDVAGGRKPARRMMLFAVFLALAAPFPLVFWKAGSATIALSAIGGFMIFRSLGESNWHPIMFDLVRPELRSTATGVSNAFNSIMGGLGAVVAGYYKASLGLQAVFGFVAIAVAFGAAVLCLAYFVFLKQDLRRAGLTEDTA